MFDVLTSNNGYILSVQNTIHDVLEERLKATHCELVVGIRAQGEQKQDNAGQKRRDSDRALTTNVFNVNREISDDRARYSNNRGDGVVAIDDVVRCGRDILACILEVLRQEGIE